MTSLGLKVPSKIHNFSCYYRIIGSLTNNKTIALFFHLEKSQILGVLQVNVRKTNQWTLFKKAYLYHMLYDYIYTIILVISCVLVTLSVVRSHLTLPLESLTYEQNLIKIVFLFDRCLGCLYLKTRQKNINNFGTVKCCCNEFCHGHPSLTNKSLLRKTLTL